MDPSSANSGSLPSRLALEDRLSGAPKPVAPSMKNGWRNQHGEPRENSDLWKQLLSAQAKPGMTVHFEWALEKKSSVLKRVDKAAKAASRAGPEIDRGYKPGAIARSMIQRSGSPIPGKRAIGGDSTVQKKYIGEI